MRPVTGAAGAGLAGAAQAPPSRSTPGGGWNMPGPSPTVSATDAAKARADIDGSSLFDRLSKTACMEAAMFSRTLAFGVALSTLAAAAATSATAQVHQSSPQQASPRQATPLANFPPTSSAGTAGTSFRVQPQNDINGITGAAAPSTVAPGIITTSPSGSSTGVQSGSAESVSRAHLFAPSRPVRAR
jgi:hypothetical protein